MSRTRTTPAPESSSAQSDIDRVHKACTDHHSQRHLSEVLDSLRRLRDGGLEFAERPVVLAAWFHDAVYEPLSPDNEADSADLARRLLADDTDRDEVAREAAARDNVAREITALG